MPENPEVPDKTFKVYREMDNEGGRIEFCYVDRVIARNAKDALATWIEQHPNAELRADDRFIVRSARLRGSCHLLKIVQPLRAFNIVEA